MKKVLTLSLLALCVSHSAVAANYTFNNDNIALSFDDTNSTIVLKDRRTNHPITPQELFFLTLPDETKIHTADFKIKHIKKQDNAIVIDFTRPDFNVTVQLNLVKGKYASIDYTIAAVGQPRDVAKITFFPTKKQFQAPYVDGAITSSPIIADSFFILPNKPIVNTYAYEATTNLNVELKTPIQPETPVSFTTWFGTFPETSQLRRSVNQFIMPNPQVLPCGRQCFGRLGQLLFVLEIGIGRIDDVEPAFPVVVTHVSVQLLTNRRQNGRSSTSCGADAAISPDGEGEDCED